MEKTFSFGICFFFFQAEDGIRDLTVTGVQTCALPIFTISRNNLIGPPCARHRLRSSRRARAASPRGRARGHGARRRVETVPSAADVRSRRSEERRVGKECRSRWPRYHEKKK